MCLYVCLIYIYTYVLYIYYIYINGTFRCYTASMTVEWIGIMGGDSLAQYSQSFGNHIVFLFNSAI